MVCPPITSLIRAEIANHKEEYFAGDSVTVRCYPDHVFIGTAMEDGRAEVTRFCLEDGTWGGFANHHCYSKW